MRYRHYTFILLLLCSIHCFAQTQKGHYLTRDINGHKLKYFMQASDTSYDEGSGSMRIASYEAVIVGVDGDSVYYNFLDTAAPPSNIHNAAKQLKTYFLDSLQPVASRVLKNGHYHFGMVTVLVNRQGKIVYLQAREDQAIMHEPGTDNTLNIDREQASSIVRELQRLAGLATPGPMSADGRSITYELDFELVFALKEGKLSATKWP